MTDFAHPSLDHLADLHEGLLPDGRSQELREHLNACDSCTAAMVALDDIQEMLATSGASAVPMPGSVAQSLDEALSRASLERAEGVSSLDERRIASKASLDASGRAASARTGRWVRMAGAAAAVVVVGYGGFTVLQNTSGADDTASDTAGGAGAKAPALGDAGGGATSLLDKAAPSVVTPKNVVPFARQLSNFPPLAESDMAPGARGCGVPVPTSAKAAVANITWKRVPAVAVIDPTDRRITIYACGSRRSRLYSTLY